MSARHDAHDPKPPGEVVTPSAPTPGEDVDVRAIVRFLVVLAVGVLVVSGLLYLFMGRLETWRAARDPRVEPLARNVPLCLDPETAHAPRVPGAECRDPSGGIRLQEKPFVDIQTMRDEQAARLNRVGWIDPKAGTVHMKIDDAMALIAKRGLPVRTTSTEAKVSAAAPSPTPAASASPTARPVPPRPRPRPAARVEPAPDPAAKATTAPAPGDAQ
jgi:hypothetical protein